jgi:malonyl-CoA/methylmalonyl-CoA synthetase
MMMTEMTLLSQLRQVGPAAGKTFIEMPDALRVTYGEFDAISARIAHAVQAAGVQKGDRVAAQVDKSAEALCLYVACLRAGAVYLPLNTAYTQSELAYFVTDAEPRLIVCRTEAEASLSVIASNAGARLMTLGTGGDGSLMQSAANQPDLFSDVPVAEDDLAAILYTSGTTGRSKGAMLTHRNLASNAVTLRDFWRFSSDDVLLHALPIYHVHGLFVAVNVALLAGASLLFLPKFDADEVVRMLPRATSMMGVPTFYTRLLAHPGFTRELVRHMRVFISGSAPLLAATHQEFEARTDHRIIERYGMTETNMNASNPYDGPRLAGTVGVPLPGVEIRITDPESGAGLPQGEVGMIEVRGPNVFSGYWRMPDKTAQEFRPDGFFITGDLGVFDDNGYLRIVGRGKDLIISGGFNVYPKEIEIEIDAIEGVRESAVVGVPHSDFGEAVTAVIVPEPGARLSQEQILRELSGRLAKFKLPKRIFFVDDLPRNSMGKVLKNELRDRCANECAADCSA